jgi:hypothetical protein
MIKCCCQVFSFLFFNFVIENQHLANFSKTLANLVEFMLLRKSGNFFSIFCTFFFVEIF